MDAYNDSSINTIYGGSEIQAYVTDPLVTYINVVAEGIDASISNALDKIVTEGGDIIYEPKPLNEIAVAKPNTGNTSFNNFRITNLATLPGITIEDIMATPTVGVNV